MYPVLTERELQVLKLIAQGLTNKQIAIFLLISLSTVENHIHHIYAKLGISNRAQAVAHFFRGKIVPNNESQEDRGNPP
jgi:two-component system nitrate/nitrite response regulator NarP